jgi:hypothetical protein
MEQSTWDYVRKWGCFVEHDPYLMPIIKPKYDVGFVLNNSDHRAAKFLEPWCSTLYLDDPVLIDFMREEIQPTTSYDMSNRIKSIDDLSEHDIIVEIDSKNLNNENAKWIGLLNEIITEEQEIGKFELEGLIVRINRVNNLNKTLVNVENEFLS